MISRVEAHSEKVSNFTCEEQRRETIQCDDGNMSYFTLEKGELVLFLRKIYIYFKQLRLVD